MDPSDLRHNPRVIAGTLSGFEGFMRFRSRVVDPLRNLLPLAVEVESILPARRAEYVSAFEARGFFVDEADHGDGRLLLAGTLDRFELLAGIAEEGPQGFGELADSVSRAVKGRFVDEFEIPWPRGVLSMRKKPLVMGVLNVTPDSFSDGGLFQDPAQAVERAFEMVEEGADLIDVGAESTRPGSDSVPVEEEIKRLDPVLKVLLERLPAPISIDTTKAEVADRYLELGAAIINDVTGLESDGRLAGVVARRGACVILNHIRGTPRTMQDTPRYDNAAAEICRTLRERLETAFRAGISEEKVILDPGIGFGKRVEDNLDVLARIEELRSLGRPIMIGCSRKSFLGDLTGRSAGERMAATAATSALAALRGVKMVRVHDVKETVDVLKVLDAINGRHQVA